MDVDKGDLFAALRAAAAGVASATGADAVRAAAVHGSLAVLGLKAHNRDVYECLEARRQSTSGAKQALEKTHLQLQNLQYEKCHYAQEIETCRDFRSAVSDSDVGLVPEEEFLRRAPPELNPTDGAAADAHARMLNRLAFELAERKELGVRLQELKSRKKALQETITSRRKLLLSLATELKTLKAATVPLAKLVEMPDRTAVHLLPAPLRTLFGHLDAVPQAASEERRFLVAVQGSLDSVAEPEMSEPGEAKEAAEEEGEEEGESTRRAKRARTSAQVHPMSVLLELHARAAKVAAIVFEFHPSRGAVVPRVEEGDAALLHGILGEGAPEQAAGDDEDVADAAAAAAPLVLQWAQKLAGLEGAADAAHAAAVVAALLAAVDR